MTESNRRGINVAAPICPIWAGLSPARIVAARTLGRLAARKSAIRRGAYKKGGSATRTPDSNRSPFGSAKAAPLLRDVLLFFRRPLFKPLLPVFPLPLSQQGRGAGWGQDVAGWGCGISLYPNAERTPCFSATPPFCKKSCKTFIQRNKNIILWRSNAKNSCRTPINDAKSPHLCRNPCNLRLCPRPAHTGHYNVRARANPINRTDFLRLRNLRPASRRFHRWRPAPPYPRGRSHRNSAFD